MHISAHRIACLQVGGLQVFETLACVGEVAFQKSGLFDWNWNVPLACVNVATD